MDTFSLENRIFERNKSHLAGKNLQIASQEQQDFTVELRKKRRRVLTQFKRIIGLDSLKHLYENSKLKCMVKEFDDSESFYLNLIELLACEKNEEVVEECLAILANCGKNKETVQVLLDKKRIKVLVECLNSENVRVLCHVSGLFVNLSAMCEDKNAINDEGIIKRLLMLSSRYPGEIEGNSVWTLCNLSNKNKGVCRFIVSINVVEALVAKIKRNPEINEKYFELLTNLTDHINDTNILKEILYIALIILKDPLFATKTEIKSSACWMIYYIINNSTKGLDMLKPHQELYPILIRTLTQETNIELLEAANFTLCEISSGPVEFCEKLLENNILDIIEKLIKHPKNTFRADGYFLLTNIAAGVSIHLKSIFKHESVLHNSFFGIRDYDCKVRNEAWHFFINISRSKCRDFLVTLIEKNFIDFIYQAVQIENVPDNIKFILDFLESLLIAEDCIELHSVKQKFNDYSLFEWISGLRYHKEPTISTLADNIMELFENNEEENN